jgi:anti-sigma regulatory factor (Ser/Thr protein kinase)
MEVEYAARHQVEIVVTEPSQVGEARRAASHLAREMGLNETQAGTVALVTSELASNLAKHAQHGRMLIRSLERGTSTGVEILSLDQGPGLADISRALEDGYSTAGTAGKGLGAVVRQSSFFDAFSVPGLGTTILSRIWSKAAEAEVPSRLTAGSLCVPVNGEIECGDSWAAALYLEQPKLMVVDGLGHGPMAAIAAREACRIFGENIERAPVDILQLAHAALRGTRGAAMAIAQLDLTGRKVHYAGIGNISGVVIGEDTTRSMVSNYGTIGHQASNFREFVYPWPEGSLLLMFSDGLTSGWRTDRYPNLLDRDPTTIASIFYRDFRRVRDDITVLIAKEPASLS